MIKVTANINGEKREVTNYSYQCNLRFCDFPNFAQLIMIYQSVKCKEPPVEGDLITLTFNSTGKDSFFYEWIISGDMYDGEIEFVCNEVDVVDIFRFWDCYCVGIEEYMNIGGTPMSLTVYLSPGIIKRNNLPVREKVWKISSPSTDKKVADNEDTQERKKETPKENAKFASNVKEIQISVADQAIMAAQAKQSLKTFQQENAKFQNLGVPPNPAATSKQKGNYGEIAACCNFLTNSNLKKGANGKQYNLKRIGESAANSLDSKIRKGIDGIYENMTPQPKFVIDESKFGTSKLSTTKKDGVQMGYQWIYNRIDKCFPNDPIKAKEIKKELSRKKVEKVLSRIDENGNVTTYQIDYSNSIIGLWP